MSHVVFLQNAWSKHYAGKVWGRSSWLKALERSHSGKRLKYLIDDFSVCENTTLQVGESPKTKLPPDEIHILNILKKRSPCTVVCCGTQARDSLLNIWDGSLIIVPHPAYRFLTNDLYREARKYIDKKFRGRIEFRQLKNGIQKSYV